MVHSLVHSHSVIDHNFADAFAGNCLRRETPWAHSGGQADPKTAKRVWKVIEKLRYYPNTQARALVSGRSRILGLIVSDITSPFFPELIKGFEDVAIQNGYEILVSSTNYDSARMALCVRRMLERKVEGVAIMTSEMDKNLWISLPTVMCPWCFSTQALPAKASAKLWSITLSNVPGPPQDWIHQRPVGAEVGAHPSDRISALSQRLRHRRRQALGRRGGPHRGRRSDCDDAHAGIEMFPDSAAGLQRSDRHRRDAGRAACGPVGTGGHFDRGFRRHPVGGVYRAAADHGTVVAARVGRACLSRASRRWRTAGRAAKAGAHRGNPPGDPGNHLPRASLKGSTHKLPACVGSSARLLP